MGSLQTPAPNGAARPFGGEKSRLAEELAFEAERASKRGETAKSVVLFTEAAELEERAAREVPTSQPRVRNVLATSAVALWVKAGKHDEAARVEAEFGVADSLG